MKAAENRRLVIVGIFIFFAIVILVAGILMLGGQQKRFVDTVRIRAVFDNVEGLKLGNNVWFSGVKIGTVKQINFYGNSQVEIGMDIEEASRQYIRKDARARLGSESLIGNKIIEIVGGSTNVAAVESNDQLQVEKSLDTDDMMATLQENNRNLVDITRDFKTLSTGLVNGKGTMGAILTDSVLADKFRTIVAGLQQASATTVRASAALSQFSNKLNTKEGLANQMLTDTVVFNQLRASAVQLEKTISATTELTNNLNQASNKLNNTNSALGVMLNDQAFAGSLKNTMQNLETSSEKLDENMKALQSNFLLRGYFKKQDKDKPEPEKTE